MRRKKSARVWNGELGRLWSDHQARERSKKTDAGCASIELATFGVMVSVTVGGRGVNCVRPLEVEYTCKGCSASS